jgi:hypothetical protein
MTEMKRKAQSEFLICSGADHNMIRTAGYLPTILRAHKINNLFASHQVSTRSSLLEHKAAGAWSIPLNSTNAEPDVKNRWTIPPLPHGTVLNQLSTAATFRAFTFSGSGAK